MNIKIILFLGGVLFTSLCSVTYAGEADPTAEKDTTQVATNEDGLTEKQVFDKENPKSYDDTAVVIPAPDNSGPNPWNSIFPSQYGWEPFSLYFYDAGDLPGVNTKCYLDWQVKWKDDYPYGIDKAFVDQSRFGAVYCDVSLSYNGTSYGTARLGENPNYAPLYNYAAARFPDLPPAFVVGTIANASNLGLYGDGGISRTEGSLDPMLEIAIEIQDMTALFKNLKSGGEGAKKVWNFLTDTGEGMVNLSAVKTWAIGKLLEYLYEGLMYQSEKHLIFKYMEGIFAQSLKNQAIYTNGLFEKLEENMNKIKQESPGLVLLYDYQGTTPNPFGLTPDYLDLSSIGDFSTGCIWTLDPNNYAYLEACKAKEDVSLSLSDLRQNEELRIQAGNSIALLSGFEAVDSNNNTVYLTVDTKVKEGDVPFKLKVLSRYNFSVLRMGGSCPVGFASGVLEIDTEDTNNGDFLVGSTGSVHDGYLGIDLYFCSTVAPGMQNIDALRDTSVMLLRNGGACPSGYTIGTVAYDTEDHSNKDGQGGNTGASRIGSRAYLDVCTPNSAPNLDTLADYPFGFFKKGPCPYTSQHGYLYLDTEDSDNKDRIDGDVGDSHLSTGSSSSAYFHMCMFN